MKLVIAKFFKGCFTPLFVFISIQHFSVNNLVEVPENRYFFAKKRRYFAVFHVLKN